jgi:hypothetical protein
MLKQLIHFQELQMKIFCYREHRKLGGQQNSVLLFKYEMNLDQIVAFKIKLLSSLLNRVILFEVG